MISRATPTTINKLVPPIKVETPPAVGGNCNKVGAHHCNKATLDSLRALHDAQNNAWRKNLETQIATLNKGFGREVLKLIPVNDAVFALRELVVQGKVPGVAQQTDLFKDDIGHPTPPLALLVTYCHLAAIYGKSPIGLPVPGSLKENPQAEALTKVLQEVAWGAVKAYSGSGSKDK